MRSTTPNGGIDGWASWAAHVMGSAMPNVIQPGAFVWFEKAQGPLVKVLPVPGLRLMKQLSVRMHFLQCGDLLDDWSVEGVQSLAFEQSKVSPVHTEECLHAPWNRRVHTSHQRSVHRSTSNMQTSNYVRSTTSILNSLRLGNNSNSLRSGDHDRNRNETSSPAHWPGFPNI
ncbi:uncharacterized protein TNCV_368561 [Trichonephila clavipes]|nr:uncharacterized protein TNCV_368561 [Trichonephila clavipes]